MRNFYGLQARLYGIVVLALLGLLVLGTVNTYKVTESLNARRHVELKNMVDSAYGAVAAQYDLFKAGKISEEQAKKAAGDTLTGMRYQDGNYFFVTGLDNKSVLNPANPKIVGKDMSAFKDSTGKYFVREMTKISREQGGGYVDYGWPKPGSDKPIGKTSYVKLFAPWGWIIGTGVYNDDIVAERDGLISTTVMVGLLIALITGSLAFFVARNIHNRVSRLGTLSGTIEELSNGNFAVQLPEVKGHDEIGRITAAIRAMVDRLSNTMTAITRASGEVNNASAEISTSTTDLSQRTEQQAASLEQTTAAMQELAQTVKRNATNAQEANRSAGTTREVADRGGQVVVQAVQAMAKIEESSRKISDIIGVIDEIARQTNLLALNAAVEAARAGEAGRGFAVVASEVRSLAQRSSQAAKDITDLITNSSGQVKDGVDLVNRAGVSLNEIVESIKGMTTVVAEIAEASSEQATGIEEINRALAQMDQAIQQNSALVEENAATAKTLEHQAQAMDEQISFFRMDSRDQRAKPAAAPAVKASAVARPAAAKPKKAVPQLKHVASGGGAAVKRAAPAADADDWKEF
ncbi:MAG: cache domain-containing protein [Proteobacteria bacterium]|nr:cache domain-containing protein [Pseudomonadota bacterium]